MLMSLSKMKRKIRRGQMVGTLSSGGGDEGCHRVEMLCVFLKVKFGGGQLIEG